MNPFHFQQFSVAQAQAGMRICTDATLFGAMAPVAPGDRVLDLGAGTGLLSLMSAQLGAARVVGVELTQEAYAEARENFRASPWARRLSAVHGDVRDAAMEGLGEFDLVISNPPFFERHSKTAAPLRNAARHTDTLSHRELLRHAAARLARDGLLYVLLPIHAVEGFLAAGAGLGLNLIYRTDVRGYAHKPAKVSALTLGRHGVPAGRRLLTIFASHRVYGPESTHYLGPFLLRFAR